MIEQNGGGVALIDYDRNGQLDLFFPNGSHFTSPAKSDEHTHCLYRAKNGANYERASHLAGLDRIGFGMGCAVGDYDNDGFADLYVAQFGSGILFRNQGDGTFSDVTEDAGVRTEAWGTSAAFADLDGDGNLDLYVVNYVNWSPQDPPCFTQHKPPVRISCGPIGRSGQDDVLYQGRGDGTFADVSRQSGIIQPNSKGLGVAIADLDNDGLLDIYIANDTTENNLLRNLGGMKFQDVGVSWGVAVGEDGLAHSGMGVACEDFDNNGHFDLCVTNFDNEPNDLYQNLGDGVFRPVNRQTGLDTISRPVLGFGIAFADFDLDSWPDLFVANGHVWDLTGLAMAYTYRMPPQLIRNVQGKHFIDVSATSGDYFQKTWLGRSVAVGDLDRDGDQDLVITHLIDSAEILRNDTQREPRGCSIRPIGRTEARDPLGVRIAVTSDHHKLVRWLPSGGSFQASNEAAVMVPVDPAQKVTVEVTWPSGIRETWTEIEPTRHIDLLEGTGRR